MADAVVFGAYELLDRVAEGGMAEVWRARARGAAGFEKIVVIKRVLPSLMANAQFAELLVREAKIAARLSHANIVQIFDLGQEQGAYFIAMEYVEGRDLGAVMSVFERGERRDGKPALSNALKLWIIAEAAKALDYAHRRRGDDGRPLAIVHRDVSPQNILLGYEGEVKVTDFGIARADERDLGRRDDPKVLRGKYGYMSPEQANGEQLDRRSDLFSLGIVLYELVSRTRLFRGASAHDTLSRVRQADVPRLDLARLGWPESLQEILDRCLAQNRDDRYESAGQLHQELSHLLFRMGEHVSSDDLAAAMNKMFPRVDRQSPNKLRVDLLVRAQDDATWLGSLAPPSGAPTEAQVRLDESTARGVRALRNATERRRVALLLAAGVARDEVAFRGAVDAFAGVPVLDEAGRFAAVFGHLGGERAVEHALRAALEWRRRTAIDPVPRVVPAPAVAVAVGDALVDENVLLSAEPSLVDRAGALLRHAKSGEVVLDGAVAENAKRAFKLSKSEDHGFYVIDGYRSRRDRDALQARRRTALVGRTNELRVLTSALIRTAEEGRGRVAVVWGEAGGGKSRLLAELHTLTTAHDFLFLAGRAYESDAGRNYAAIADLWSDICGIEAEDAPSERFVKVERLRVLGLSARQIYSVGTLLGIAYPVAPPDDAGHARSIELLSALRRALVALSKDRVVVVALKDLQWMDDATRQLLPLLVADAHRARVLVVITSRPGTTLPSFGAEVVELKPLDRDRTARVFASAAACKSLSAPLRDYVYAESAGNPFLIEELANTMSEVGALDVRDGAAFLRDGVNVPVPEPATTLLSSRLALLSHVELELLRIASAFRGPVATQILAQVASVPLDVAEGPLWRLLWRRKLSTRSGWVAAPRPVGRWGGGSDAPQLPADVHVTSGILRRVVLRTMDEAERARLHSRIVAVLERDSSHRLLDELAYHAQRADEQRRTVDYILAAAELARTEGRMRAASEWYRDAVRAIARAGDDHDGARRFELAHDGAELAIGAGDAALATEVLDGLDELPVVRASRENQARLVRLRAACAALRGDMGGRLAVLLPARADFGSLANSELGRGSCD